MAMMRTASVWIAAAMLLAPAAAAQAPPDPGVDIENRGTVAIKEINIKADGTAGWGENKLGGGPLAPGRTVSIREGTETNCRYQMRAVFANGRAEQRPVDVCSHQRVVLGGTR